MARRSSWSSTTRMCFVMRRACWFRREPEAPSETSRPCPAWTSTQMRPPCISTIFLAIANPSPVPPLVFVLELSIWWNSSKIRSRSSGGMPGPVSRHVNEEATAHHSAP